MVPFSFHWPWNRASTESGTCCPYPAKPSLRWDSPLLVRQIVASTGHAPALFHPPVHTYSSRSGGHALRHAHRPVFSVFLAALARKNLSSEYRKLYFLELGKTLVDFRGNQEGTGQGGCYSRNNRGTDAPLHGQGSSKEGTHCNTKKKKRKTILDFPS